MSKRVKREKIIAKLGEVEVRLSRAGLAGEAFRAIGVIKQTHRPCQNEDIPASPA